MNEADRDTIRRNIVALSEDMDFDSVSFNLYSEDIFEKGHIEEFQAQPSLKKKNRELLMVIQTRGPTAFSYLVESLVKAKQEFLAKKLGYSGSAPSEEQVQASTPHEPVWPPQDNNGDYSTSQMDTFTSYVPSLVNSEEVYKMTSKPRGLALIINNENFMFMPRRNGTNVDSGNLENIFKQLLFEVHVHKDCKRKQIEGIIEQLRSYDHSQFDCLIFAILSHGEDGTVYGTDDKVMKIEDIVSQFGSDRCPTLKGKPKLFFLQACRGKRFDKGVVAADGAEIYHGPAGDNRPQVDSQMDDEELAQMMLEKELDSTDSFASSRSKVPSQSDMLLAYATVPGFVSWRNSERGSWFIQALTEVILKCAKDEDLLSMMTKVNAKVARAFVSSSSSGRHKQMPAPVTMLTKKLYFFPGHYE